MEFPLSFRTCIKRLQNETQSNSDLKTSPLHLNADKRLQLTLQIPGPDNSPYKGKIYDLEISYDSSYPFSAPYLRFITPIFHPNIHPSGRMSNLLVEPWSPIFTIINIYENAQQILLKPLKEFPYNEEAMTLWESDLVEFVKKVQSI